MPRLTRDCSISSANPASSNVVVDDRAAAEATSSSRCLSCLSNAASAVRQSVTCFCIGITSGPTRLWSCLFTQAIISHLLDEEYGLRDKLFHVIGDGIILQVKALDAPMHPNDPTWYGITYKYQHELVWYQRNRTFIKIPKRPNDEEPYYPEYLKEGEPIVLAMISGNPTSAVPLETLQAMKQDIPNALFQLYSYNSCLYCVDSIVEYVFVIGWWLPIVLVAIGYVLMGGGGAASRIYYWTELFVVEAAMLLLGILYCYYRHWRFVQEFRNGAGLVKTSPQELLFKTTPAGDDGSETIETVNDLSTDASSSCSSHATEHESSSSRRTSSNKRVFHHGHDNTIKNSFPRMVNMV